MVRGVDGNIARYGCNVLVGYLLLGMGMSKDIDYICALKEERVNTILESISQAHKDGTLRTVAPPKPVDISVEDAFNIVFERYEGTFEELSKV